MISHEIQKDSCYGCLRIDVKTYQFGFCRKCLARRFKFICIPIINKIRNLVNERKSS
jgi:hypothetical protein